VYHQVEHAWHYIRQQPNTSREMVDEHTHAIVHLEHANEQQDFDLTKRAVMIASLE
jgi:hypothetical protein